MQLSKLLGGGMFGLNDNQAMGGGSSGHPSMLDNVAPQDFQTPANNSPASQTTQSQTTQPQYFGMQPQNNLYQPQAVSHDSTTTSSNPPSSSTANDTSNPFVQNPIGMTPQADNDGTAQSAQNASLINDFTNDVTPKNSSDSSNTDSNSSIDHEKLAAMKQQALAHLEPLADKLDGSPEETFRTTMMMIQANDNHKLLEKAFDLAKKIEDDKLRAQAMLDIINEINYFSQADED